MKKLYLLLFSVSILAISLISSACCVCLSCDSEDAKGVVQQCAKDHNQNYPR